MTTATVLGAVAAATGSVMALSPLLQARVMRRTGSSRDVSLGSLWTFVANCIGWLAYGVALGSMVIIVPNSIALCSLVVAISVATGYRRQEMRTAGPAAPGIISAPVGAPITLAATAGPRR
jgi:uncharacterized protein with PQ loop repeat